MPEKYLEVTNSDFPEDDIPEIAAQVINGAKALNIYSSTRIFKVEVEFYHWELEQRKVRLVYLH
jgi:hypothetical protein